MKVLKKIGQIFLCPLPLILMLLLQVVAVFGFMLVLAIQNPRSDPYTLLMDQYSLFLLYTQCITLFVFFFWYFLAYGRKKPFLPPGQIFSGKDLGIFLLLSVGLYCLISVYMGASSVAAPDLMKDYMEMVEETGMGDLTLLSNISTLIMAPLSEEIIFRGITLNLSKKAFRYFWIANIIQALLFGIAHMNWIQGTYAFFLGLVLGYAYEAYHSLFAGMLLHLLFNFMGTYGAASMDLLPIPALVFYMLMLVLGLPVTIFCLFFLRKKKNPPPKPAYWTGEPMD